uniref:N-acetylgalactosaminide beta-1,3-galactosyltransferase n=1 Tax=Panagrellus redivivus TaxID=6233 RepID=A0A7E4V6X6_PANRE
MRVPVASSAVATLSAALLIVVVAGIRRPTRTTAQSVTTDHPVKTTTYFNVGHPLPSRKTINETRGYREPKILCLVHTAAPSHQTLARTVYEVWAKKCDDVLFFSDAPINWEVPHVYYPMFSTRDHSWEKIRHILQFVHQTTYGKYDWYLRADDDAFVVVENARKLVSRMDPTHDFLLGFRWGFFEHKGYADGSTYILSKKAVDTFVTLSHDEELCPEFHRAEEDQEMGRCLAKLGITPMDSRDNQGRDRFHQFHPEQMMDIGIQHFVRRFGYYRVLPYPDQVSPSTVSMHHLSPYEMRFYDFLLNKVKVADL